jgi:hypothetical protein
MASQNGDQILLTLCLDSFIPGCNRHSLPDRGSAGFHKVPLPLDFNKAELAAIPFFFGEGVLDLEVPLKDEPHCRNALRRR